ncbi:hypothetical protein [Mucilaginibacter ginsenosidivorax]|uniref:Uncharacterized protein n=1 Tax=Mucilaginibacter ginsenosidivorax TaxID=862126 RepID=A0A5B8VYH7_9SPHI|nr:hypothetical protein [Mucilaginibacter ginsenosidivorax]QEC76509.1 hypothetical protein FSB76_11330 [Mucilaginibacter ginsenosidivorax]
MHLKITLLLALFFLTGYVPANNSPGQDKRQHVIMGSAGVYSSRGNGDITININGGVLTGVYEYYDNWDDQFKEYRNINVFYIYGTSSDGVNYKINTIWPGDSEGISGILSFTGNKKIKIILNSQPLGYASFDFTANTVKNIFSLKASSTATGIRLIKPAKAPLYNYDGKAFIKRNGYLIKGNIVTLLSTNNEFAQISYHSPTTDKNAIYWLNTIDLYDANPALW